MEEVEVKFLDIDKAQIEKKLTAIGATKVGDYFYRHLSFDYPDRRLDEDNSWIRLRNEGDRITLTFKKRLGVSAQDGSANDEGMEEVEFDVSDYDKTSLFLTKVGFEPKHEEAQKKRTRWTLGVIEFDIDEVAMIPPYLEIEAPTWDDISKAIQLLELNPENQKICSSNQLYRFYGIDTTEYQTINFDEQVKKSPSL